MIVCLFLAPIESAQYAENESADKLKPLDFHDKSSGAEAAAANEGGLKVTLSQAMMNSNLLNQLPKYIFQSEHERLKSVKHILDEVKEQQSRDNDPLASSGGEVSEYPIEYYEHQQHALQRHMSIK